jgi:hypothetical protein
MSSFRIITLFTLLATASSVPARRLTVDDAMRQADLVVEAEVADGLKAGMTIVEINGKEVPALRRHSSLRIKAVLQGACADSRIEAAWLFPQTSSGVGYKSLLSGSRIVFLRKTSAGWEIAVHELPSIPATVLRFGATSDPRGTALKHLSSVALDEKESRARRLEAINQMTLEFDPAVNRTLRSLLAGEDRELYVIAGTSLLQRNDKEALETMLPLLLRPLAAEYPWYSVMNLASAMASGIRTPTAVSSLGSIVLRSKVTEFRKSAAFALRNIGTPEAVRFLAAALDDADQEVRYQAVIGLGEILSAPEFRPLEPEFQRDEAKYLRFW